MERLDAALTLEVLRARATRRSGSRAPAAPRGLARHRDVPWADPNGDAAGGGRAPPAAPGPRPAARGIVHHDGLGGWVPMSPQPLDHLRNLADRLPDGDQRTAPDALYDAFVGWAGDQGFELYPAQQDAVLELVTGSHV